jgi:hypothetical protein
MSKLIIDLNDEYKVRIETAKEFDQSIFRYIYINAAKNVCEMINQSENKPSHDAYNNIIAFTGERGKGKSSCMISFKNALIGHQNPEHTPFFNRLDLSSIRDKKFASIDIIDPSLFRFPKSIQQPQSYFRR